MVLAHGYAATRRDRGFTEIRGSFDVSPHAISRRYCATGGYPFLTHHDVSLRLIACFSINIAGSGYTNTLIADFGLRLHFRNRRIRVAGTSIDRVVFQASLK